MIAYKIIKKAYIFDTATQIDPDLVQFCAGSAQAQHLHLVPRGFPGFDLQKVLDPDLGHGRHPRKGQFSMGLSMEIPMVYRGKIWENTGKSY